MEEIKRKEGLELLRENRENASVAFMEFCSYKECYKEYLFVFYEGEDRKYYNQRIRDFVGSKIIQIKAGNKKNVIKVMKQIDSQNQYNNVKTVFFVDRDMDFNMPEYNSNNLYVTPCYSIENLYVNEYSLGLILEDEFGLNSNDNDYNQIMSNFSCLYKDFCDKMTVFNALVLLRNEKKLNEDKVCINNIKTSHLIKIDIINRSITFSIHYEKVISDLSIKLNVMNDEEIKQAVSRLSSYGDPCDVFRGKNQLDFMIEFIDQLCKYKKEIIKSNKNSISINPKQNRLSTLSRYAKTPDNLIKFLINNTQ